VENPPASNGLVAPTSERPGTLLRNAKYLHQRTGGSISTLFQLIRTAAITAIVTNTEAMTRDLLDATSIDHAAETATPHPRAPQ
jgi:hypothetical protein